MRRYALVLLLSVTYLSAQSKGITKDSLSISKTIGIHETIVYENLSIQFNRLIQDSRCPKDVTCVRAGEADIELVIQLRDEAPLSLTSRIDASGFVTETNNLILETDSFKVYAFALTPYPISTEPIDLDVYKLEVVYIPKKQEQ